MDVLIVGASARAAAWSACRAGLKPAAIDLFADRDLAAIAPCVAIEHDRYPQGLVDLAARFPQCPWMYTGAIENAPAVVEALAARRTLWGCDAQTLRGARDPLRVAEVLERAGLSAVPVQLDPAGLPRDGSWLRKPLASAGGIGVVPWDAASEPRAGDTSYYHQRRVHGLDLSAIFVGGGDGAVLAGVTRQFLGRSGQPFAHRGNLAPWPVREPGRSRIAAAGEALARAFGLVGLFGLDLVLSDGEPWVVEINPRYTAAVEVVELSLGVPLMESHHASGEGRFEAVARAIPLIEPTRYVAREVLFADGPMVLSDEPDGWRVPDPFEVPEAADLPALGSRFEEGAPVVTVFGKGATPRECLERLASRRKIWRARLRPTSP